MKKHYYLFVFAMTMAFSFSSFASSNISKSNTQSQISIDQKVQKEEKKKSSKYDFSLFKFIAPKSSEEKDSTIEVKEKRNIESQFSNETTDVFDDIQKPRSFFKLSYAS